MLKHAAIIGVSVISAVIAAQAVVMLAGARAAPALAVQSVTTPIAATAVLAEDTAPAPAQVTKASDGHYWAQAQVNGRWVKFLVDTGASTVALTGADAQRLGFDLDTLSYVHPVITGWT